jgi:hypothetical protein
LPSNTSNRKVSNACTNAQIFIWNMQVGSF